MSPVRHNRGAATIPAVSAQLDLHLRHRRWIRVTRFAACVHDKLAVLGPPEDGVSVPRDGRPADPMRPLGQAIGPQSHARLPSRTRRHGPADCARIRCGHPSRSGGPGTSRRPMRHRRHSRPSWPRRSPPRPRPKRSGRAKRRIRMIFLTFRHIVMVPPENVSNDASCLAAIAPCPRPVAWRERFGRSGRPRACGAYARTCALRVRLRSRDRRGARRASSHCFEKRPSALTPTRCRRWF